MKKRILTILGIVCGALVLIVIANIVLGFWGLMGLQESHIEANVPEKDVFAEYMTRDLSAYFSEKLGEEVEASYELLREEPTQVGLADPKFYAWVNIKSTNTGEIITQGAVRVAAQEKTHFFVTDYISVEQIKAKPEILSVAFPEQVADRIRSRI